MQDRGQTGPNPAAFMLIFILVISIVARVGMEIMKHIPYPNQPNGVKEIGGPFLLFGGPLEVVGFLGVLVATVALLKAIAAKEYPVTTFATIRHVYQRPLRSYEADLTPCADCGWIVEDGVVREYRAGVVLFGVPFAVKRGENRYCEPCSGDEQPVVLSTPQPE